MAAGPVSPTNSEALAMISPADPVPRFYDALGRGDVPGGQDLLREDPRQQQQRRKEKLEVL